MSKFTSGTWSVGINGKYGPYVYANEGDAIIAVIRSCGYISESEGKETVRQANARLIAAAPEMYRMLREELIPTSDYGGMLSFSRESKVHKLLACIDGEEAQS